ncbi:MAG: aspartyl-phosphate phosphatase Spo0E family protein [Clostridium sp.]|nr:MULTISPECIES: aspartyl-phosphate phosphatase Spo0E family protein [Clostridium]MDU1585747.1 aspartyl-phosphate phosphatase Spo0E family protein [Clostridium sp.]MDU1976938.1 aspartyl-phosphate phosphatase Spo0E family protein [Clostridium sp.]MDU1992505.1 aspartyl-phosphate phosphatase Spo0E family protein [Clostridium sp.]MDU4318471.1 aspartyl-phosphate phosphatase Spo0E family protein [Clostridium sp.]
MERIEELRAEMHELIENKGIEAIETINKSKELDEEIVKFYYR